MRLVFVTQRIDPDDPVLGATVAKVRSLAERVDEIAVFTDSAAPGALPANCRLRSFAAGSKAGRGARFEAALSAELRHRPRPDAVFAHMCPIYAVLAAPLTKPLRIPLILWWTHWNRTRTLELAEKLVDRIVSVDERSVPIASSKVVPIGHGIDMEQFSCGDAAQHENRLEALALGRYSAAKGLLQAVTAVAAARSQGADVRLRCHGTTGTPQEVADRAALEELVVELKLAEAVEIGGPVSRAQVPVLLRSGDLLVNNMRPGAADKVVFEAAACCLPVVASNPSFAPLLDGLEPRLRFERDDPDDLGGRLVELARLSAAERRALGVELRRRVEQSHSTESWADGVLSVVESVR